MDAARAPRTAGIVAVALALVGIGGLCRSCLGESDPHCPAGVPDVWTVSTRGLPGICRLPDAVNFRIERLRGDGSAWERSDLPSMLDDPQQPVMVFIHGNRYGHREARQQGLDLARRAEACGVPGLRTIVYSWPSEQQGILLKDGRAKYDRAFAEGRYLAWLLGRLDPGRPVAIVGYSFGAIITLEALEDLAVAEQTAVPGWHPWSGRPAPVNVVFIAPAIRCDAIAPRGPYRETVGSIDRLTLLTNPIDDALKYFHLIDRSLRADALGYVGMPRSWVPASMEFSCVDASNIVGRTHGFSHYLASPTLMRRICAGATTGLAAPAE